MFRLLFIVVGIVLAIGLWFQRQSTLIVFPVTSSLVPTPTPIPFVEMTIPHLRSRTYVSKLNELNKLSENSLYTVYRTSYDSDGLKIYGLLTIPKNNNSKHPAVVFVHGYIPPTLYKTNEKYVEYVDYLARQGLVVFKIDLRGHDQSEGEPGGAYYSSDYVIDVLNAREALLKSDFIKPNSVGLWGHSMAGNVLMRAFAVRPEIPAVVIWAGAGYTYTDLLTYRISDLSYRPPMTDTQRQRQRQKLRETYGEFNPNFQFWKQVAVTDYLKDIKGALELHHAVDDNVVSIEYSRNLMKLLDQTSVIHQLFEYSSGGHNISGVSFGSAIQRTSEFFKKYLD